MKSAYSVMSLIYIEQKKKKTLDCDNLVCSNSLCSLRYIQNNEGCLYKNALAFSIIQHATNNIFMAHSVKRIHMVSEKNCFIHSMGQKLINLSCQRHWIMLSYKAIYSPCIKGIVHPKMKIHWKCTRPQAIYDKYVSRQVCFFIRTNLQKFSITSLAHQWILCGEWVLSETDSESKKLIKTSQ